MYSAEKVEAKERKIQIPENDSQPHIEYGYRLVAVGDYHYSATDKDGNPLKIAQDVTMPYDYEVWINFARNIQGTFTNVMLYLLDEHTAYECLSDEFQRWLEETPAEAFND